MLEKVFENKTIRTVIKDNLTPNQVARLQNYNKLLMERQVEQLDKKNDKLIEMIVQTVFKNRR